MKWNKRIILIVIASSMLVVIVCAIFLENEPSMAEQKSRVVELLEETAKILHQVSDEPTAQLAIQRMVQLEEELRQYNEAVKKTTKIKEPGKIQMDQVLKYIQKNLTIEMERLLSQPGLLIIITPHLKSLSKEIYQYEKLSHWYNQQEERIFGEE